MFIKEITLRPKTGSSSKSNASSFYHRPRIYVWPEGETIMENLQNRRGRPYNVYKKEVLPALFRVLGLRDITVGWSQKAGCTMCPCSPGFIVKDGNVPWDIHVTVTDDRVAELVIKGRPQDVLAIRS